MNRQARQVIPVPVRSFTASSLLCVPGLCYLQIDLLIVPAQLSKETMIFTVSTSEIDNKKGR